MVITDTKLLDLLKKYYNSYLMETLEDMTEDDIEEETETETVSNEIDWLMYKYSEPGYYEHDHYKECKNFIKKLHSKQGVTVEDVREVTTQSIEDKKQVIKEYDNLLKLADEIERQEMTHRKEVKK